MSAIRGALLAAVLVASSADAQEYRFVRAETPDDVVQWVVTDLVSLPESERDHMRYLWLPSWSRPSTGTVASYAVNMAVSRSGRIVQPTLLAGGVLQRWDMRQLISDDGVRLKVVRAWDAMATNEPYFRSMYAFAPSEQTPQPPLSRPVAEKVLELSSQGLGSLTLLPVYRADWFISRALSAIDGGSYLELRGLSELLGGEDGRTPEQLALARFGIFEDTAIQVDGDRRVGMVQSQVTGKPRIVRAVRGAGGTAWITDDVLDNQDDERRHPLYNLLEQDYAGREIIVEMSNGLHLFLITDGEGNLLREAPETLVADHRVPPPYTRRLDGGPISCVRCHASGAGLRDVANDVATILRGPVSVIADSQVVADVETRFSGRDFSVLVERGREDYERAIDEVAGGAFRAEELGDETAAVYQDIVYDLVTPMQALTELGMVLEDPDDAVAVFRSVVELRDVDAAVVPGVVLEDPTVALLYAGVPVRRRDFERLYGVLLERARNWRLR